MRIANSRHAWLRRGVTGRGLAGPLALAPALPVTIHQGIPSAEGDRPIEVTDLTIDDVASPPPARR